MIARVNAEVRFLMFGTLIGLFIYVLIPLHLIVQDTRFYRDTMGMTAFRGVTIDRTEVHGSDFMVSGSFIKVRCTKIEHAAYTRDRNGVLWPAEFDPSAQPAGTPESRPESGFPMQFGPWRITARHPGPVEAVFYVRHDCPEGPKWAMFFSLPWKSTGSDDQ